MSLRFSARLGLLGWLSLTAVAQSQSIPPQWWIDRGIVDTNATPNDFSVANLGQFKWFITNSFDEFDQTLFGGAGTNLQALVSSLGASDHFAAVNQGQLKHVVSQFYNRLYSLGYTNALPWTESTGDDQNFTLANIGQLKHVFHFGLEAWLDFCTWTETSDYRINVGGTNYVDSQGHFWSDDEWFWGGSTFQTGSSIFETPDDYLYQTERYGDFGYHIPVSNGFTRLTLHFVEIYHTQVGMRVFDVFVEGSNVINALDIWDLVGKDEAYTQSMVVVVQDCILDIDFVAGADNPKLSAIQVEYFGLELPAPQLDVHPQSFDFGTNYVNQLPGVVSVVASNSGTASLNISSLDFMGSHVDVFSVTPPAPLVIQPGGATNLTVTFSPTNAGPAFASLEIISNADTSPDLVLLNGHGEIPPPQIVSIPPHYTFGVTQVGTSAPQVTLLISNIDVIAHTLMMNEVLDDELGEYVVTPQTALPAVLAPGETHAFDVGFIPARSGIRPARAKFHFDFHTLHHFVPISGLGQGGGTTTLYRVNAGGPSFTNGSGEIWQPDTPYKNTGNTFTSPNAISGTTQPELYQSQRWDPPTFPELQYTFPATQGLYRVRLHFAETFSGADSVGARVFDVQIENQIAITNLDIFSEVGLNAALIKDFDVAVTDSAVNVSFLRDAENPNVSGIEIFKDDLEVVLDTYKLEWGHVSLGQTGPTNTVVLTNLGGAPVDVTELQFILLSGVLHDFTVTINGSDYSGDHSSTNIAVNFTIPAGGTQQVQIVFDPTEEVGNDFFLQFAGDFIPPRLRLSGTGGEDTGHPYLHVVIRHDPYYIDFDGDGSETVFLDGRDSHTHEFGHFLTTNQWVENGIVFETNTTYTGLFSNGVHDVTMTIYDDNVPPEHLSLTKSFAVLSATNIPGILARYYLTGSTNPSVYLDALPALPDFGERVHDFCVEAEAGKLGSMDFQTNMVARLNASVRLDTAGSYAFTLQGGVDTRLSVDGSNVTGAIVLSQGIHTLETRYTLISLTNAPLKLLYTLDGGSSQAFPASALFHDESTLPPIINTAPAGGFPSGGEAVQITGLGFFNADDLILHWGSTNLQAPEISISDDLLSFSAPPGDGTVQIYVEISNGVSRTRDYIYSAGGPAPVNFDEITPVSIIAPTQGAWGPDGRLYVATISGTIEAFTFDDSYGVVTQQVITGVSTMDEVQILGIAFNPCDSATNIRIYVAHSELYAQGGVCSDDVAPYNGRVSIIEGTNLETVTTLVSGLPVSNHDHGINGLAFDENGDLLICVGGQSNAGIEDCNIGGLPESPLSAAIVIAEISKPGFNGDIKYVQTGTSVTNNDQRFGDIVDVAEGVDVRVYAAGFRNPFDIVWTTRGEFYATDNGPNVGFGPASTGPSSLGPDPEEDDELILIRDGHYYGHANRNRGRYDGRENIYYGSATSPPPYQLSQALATFTPSVDGIVEYRASTFNNALRGNLLIQKWNGTTHSVVLSSDGESVVSVSALPVELEGLDVITGPGGAVLGMDYSVNEIKIAVPIDVAAVGLTVYDIHPWRAKGEAPFVIGGSGFGSISNTAVTFGGVSATLTSVSATRIRGLVPANATPRLDMLDITVSVSGVPRILPEAFTYALDAGTAYNGKVSILVDPGGTLNESSTYGNNSFRFNNISSNGRKIERFEIATPNALFPDIVFDPTGAAGDPVGKDFTIDFDGGVGYVTNAFLGLHDGGFDILRVDFTNWSVGKGFDFSVDLDPTSISGAAPPGPSHSGSISGLELTGADISLTFDDGTVIETSLFAEPGSVTASEVKAKRLTPPRPVMHLVGVGPGSANVTNAAQTVRVFAPTGSTVDVVVVEASLYTNGVLGAGFDIDPFEANTALSITQHTSVVSIDAWVDVPVTLSASEVDGGYNVIMSAIRDDDGDTGQTSERLVLKLPYSSP